MNTAAELISLLFLSRDVAHREHLKTKSYAQHVALGNFYEAIVDLADAFAETYQGGYGIISDIPLAANKDAGKPIDDALEAHLAWVEKNRAAFSKPQDRPLQNIIDEICALYLRTLYKLRNLK